MSPPDPATESSTVLVTGGAGFIGSTLVDRMLAEGRRVVVVDNLSTGLLANLDDARRNYRGQLDFQRLDVTSESIAAAVARQRPQVIFHLAAQPSVPESVANPVRDAMINVIGTINLLQAAVDAGVRKVVFASSGGAIHGEADSDELPSTEESPPAPVSPYGAAKLAVEPYLRVFGVLHGLEWTVLAIANAYGPRQSSAGEGPVIAVMIDRMLDNEDVTVTGDGGQTRDFVYVDDVVHALALAADRGHGRRYNIGTGDQTSINQLFQALSAATGYDRQPVHAPDRPGDVTHSALSPRRAADDLGWKPWTRLEEGLAATLEWAASRR